MESNATAPVIHRENPGQGAGQAPEASLRALTVDDLEAIADIHLSAFADAALTALGREAVVRQYRWFLEGPHDAVCMGAWVDQRLAGYCFSGLFKGAAGGFIRKNRGFLLKSVLRRPVLLLNPLFRDRARTALRLLNPFRKRRRPESIGEWWEYYGILSIAVDPRAQGSGVGRSLMRCAESAARERGVPRMILTVSPSNARAVRFYEKQGWRKQETPGTWTGVMEKPLEEASDR